MGRPIRRLGEWHTLNDRVSEAEKRVRGDGYSEKVFGIGLSRTGTTSLTHALQRLGYEAIHYDEDGDILSLNDLYRYDAATDTPCSARFEQLYYAFPESRFIYTTRAIDSWVESVTHHFEESDPSKVAMQYEKGGRGVLHSDNFLSWVFIHESLYGRFDSWEEAYRAFDERVRSFFDRHDSDRLLTISITGDDGWEELCRFLGKEVPSADFPHKNKRASAG